MISALIADDESILRQSMREQLQAVWPELNIVAEAQDGESAVALLQQFKPDIAFLDIQMPGLSGLEVAARAPAHTRVVFITAYHTHAVAAFEADAVDYVLKPVELSRLGRVVGKLQRALASP